MLGKNSGECKKHYNNTLLLVSLGCIWILSTLVARFETHLSILVLFVGVAMVNLFHEGIRQFLALPEVDDEYPARMAMRALTLGVPLGMTAGFYTFSENMNMFFPVFLIVFGVIFGLIGGITNVKSFIALAVVMLAGGIYIAYCHEEKFTAGGYFGGVSIIVIGLTNLLTKSAEVNNTAVRQIAKPVSEYRKAA